MIRKWWSVEEAHIDAIFCMQEVWHYRATETVNEMYGTGEWMPEIIRHQSQTGEKTVEGEGWLENLELWPSLDIKKVSTKTELAEFTVLFSSNTWSNQHLRKVRR